MRYMQVFLATAILMTSFGCSCISTVERANLTSAASREEYISSHPDGVYNDCISNGEIMYGMTAHEVIASWGLPNVYMVTRTTPSEQWIYYIKDRGSLAMLIYTLGFSDDTLRVWDIDQKRLVGQEIVSHRESDRGLPDSSHRTMGKK